MNKKEEITMTPLNITLFIFAIIFLIYAINSGLKTADSEYAARKDKFLQMPMATLGEYIVKKNNRINHIDRITSIRPIRYVNNSLHIDYDVKKGFLQEIVGKIESLEASKKRVKTDLISENCTKSSHLAFLEKGGIIHYNYHLSEKNHSKLLFSFEIKETDCTQKD